MMIIYVVVSICVGVLTIAGVFMRLAFRMGQMTQQLENVVEAIETISGQVKELFEWRYKDALRNQKGRGRLPSD